MVIDETDTPARAPIYHELFWAFAPTTRSNKTTNSKRLLLSRKYEQFWEYIHPHIKTVAQGRFHNMMYADAVEASLKELNTRVKKIVKKEKGIEDDGASLMYKCFSANNPILTIYETESEDGHNVQAGYMQIFAGVMTGIRNPKAHNNQVISKQDAIGKLHLASLLMYKIDDAVRTTGIQE